MPDNIELDAGSGGAVVASASLSISGDTANVEMVGCGILSGSEDSWTYSDFVGGAGAVAAGVQRVTLASNDPGVALLTTIDADTGAIKTAVELIDNAISGSEMQVDVVASLPAGTNAIGKLAANTGVDIGDVDILSVVPGTGATNLGKSIDSVVGATDTGVALLGKHSGDSVHITTADGDYEVVRISDFGALQASPEQHHTFDAMNATTGWAALSNDTLNLATTKKHILGTDALTFDKVNGAANTIFAGIAKTISSVDLGDISPHDLIQTMCYLPTLTDVAYVFVRVGTDSSNYAEWRVADTDLTAATFEVLALSVGDSSYAGITGNGWNPSAITYIVVGVAFDAETNALAGIVFDEVSFHTNQHTSATLNAEVSSSVSSANVNLQKIGGSPADKGAGNVSNGSQRVVLATDDVNATAIKTAVELIDDPVAVLGTATYSEATTKGTVVGAVRNDDLATLANTDNEIAPLQVNSAGALFTEFAQQIDYVFDGSEKGTIERAAVLAATGTVEIAAAPSGTQKIRVLALAMLATSTTVTNVYLKTTTNDILGDASNPIRLAVDADGDNITGFILPWNPGGWFETQTADEALSIVLSAAQDVIVSITWVDVD